MRAPRLPARRLARSGAGRASRRRLVRAAALSRPARRGYGLVLLWHRVRPSGPAPHEVVPSVPTDLFRRQVAALGELGEIVPLAALDGEEPAGRPRFALTFDDDDPGHARHTLPVLAEHALPATFFLSGRWLHGRGPYWWEVLEDEIVAEGLAAVASRLGRAATTPAGLAAALEGTPDAFRLDAAGHHRRGRADLPDGEDAKALAAAGMEIGFHTVDHPVLTLLDDTAAAAAATQGRDALAADVGRPVDRFSYPHGKVDERIAGHVARAGYTSAWTSSHQPAAPGDDPHLRGRWEAGARDVDDFVLGVLRRLAVPGGLPSPTSIRGGKGARGR